MKVALVLCALAALPATRAGAQQVSPLTAALRLAQDGRIDSARATLARMEQSTVPTDSVYPGILYSSALVSPTAEDVRQKLQRVILEYPFSPWSEPAMIALAQLDYANGDPAAAGRTLEKFRTDHATSSLYAIAALWGARAGFDANDSRAACQWVNDGLARAGSDPTTRAELVALGRRCPATAAAPPAVATVPGAPQPNAPVVTPPAAPPPAPDTVVKPTTAAAPPVDTAVKPAPAATIKPAAPPPAPAVVPDAYRVQIVAANSLEAADEMLDRAKKAGFSGVIVKEGGYFKVRLGQYATRADATAAAAKVKARLGGSPFVVAP